MITVNFDLNPAALRAIARCVNAHHECEAVDLEDHAAAVRVLEQVVGVGAITLNLDDPATSRVVRRSYTAFHRSRRPRQPHTATPK